MEVEAGLDWGRAATLLQRDGMMFPGRSTAEPSSDASLEKLQRENSERQIRRLRRAVEDATWELWEGRLSFREAEVLAREVTAVRAQISALERSLHPPPSEK